LNNPLHEFGSRLDRALRAAVCAAAAGAAGAVALLFFSIAAFVAIRDARGTVEASLALGCAYLLVALIAVVVLVAMQRRARREREEKERRAREAARAGPAWWQDPAVLSAGVQAARMFGVRATVPLGIAAALAGFFLGGAARDRGKGGGTGTSSADRS